METARQDFRPPVPHFTLRLAALFALLFLLVSCNQAPTAPPRDYQIIHTYPHDTNAFTEGLFYLNGFLYESTGLYGGQSSVRKVELETGKVLQQINLPSQYFGEGMVAFNGKLYQLTWKEKMAFVYNLDTFKQEGQFFYPFEGWGLTTDGKSLISSDGTAQIRFLEPLTFQVQRTITVTEQGVPLGNINELEWIKGQIYANVWGTDRIVRIDPTDGRVLADVDLSGLLSDNERAVHVDVLNGIAYDAAGDRLFITGKFWPKLFEIKLTQKP